jgi:hypothetical protein
MQSGPSFFTQNTTEDVIIKTTLNQSIQKAAEDGLNFIFENQVREGSKAQVAIVVMSADGAVVQWLVGEKVSSPVHLTGHPKLCDRLVQHSNLSSTPLLWTWVTNLLIL